MKKIITSILRWLKSKTVNNIIGVVLLALMTLSLILMSFIEIDAYWNKIFATCYVGAVILLLLFFGTPRANKGMDFRKPTTWAFVTWCVVLPIILGTFITIAVNKIMPAWSVDDIGFASMSASIIIISFAWFGEKLCRKENTTYRLDLFSTIWISILTVLTTAFNLENKKLSFVILLAAYFVLQIFIKAKICKIEEEKKRSS